MGAEDDLWAFLPTDIFSTGGCYSKITFVRMSRTVFFFLKCAANVSLEVKRNPCFYLVEIVMGNNRKYFFKHYLSIVWRIPIVPFQSWRNFWCLIGILTCTPARQTRSIRKNFQAWITKNFKLGFVTHFLESCLLQLFLFIRNNCDSS